MPSWLAINRHVGNPRVPFHIHRVSLFMLVTISPLPIAQLFDINPLSENAASIDTKPTMSRSGTSLFWEPEESNWKKAMVTDTSVSIRNPGSTHLVGQRSWNKLNKVNLIVGNVFPKSDSVSKDTVCVNSENSSKCSTCLCLCL